MNLSRAATLAHGELFSVGRVQTPTLALLVEREKAIRAFVPEEYLEVEATFAPDAAAAPSRADDPATAALPRDVVPRRAADPRGPAAADGRARGEGHRRARAERAGARWSRSSRRRAASRRRSSTTSPSCSATRTALYGLSAKETLAAAQALYEEQKLLTYPRTDSRHLSRDVAAGLPAVVAAIAGPYAPLLAPGTGERPARPALRRRLEGDRPPRHRPHRGLGRRARPHAATSAASTTSSAGACSWPGTTSTSSRSPRVVTRVASGRARDRGPLRELGHGGAAGGLEGPRPASLAPGPTRPAATAGTTRAIRRGPPAGPRRRPAEARRRGRGRARRRPGRPGASPTRRC